MGKGEGDPGGDEGGGEGDPGGDGGGGGGACMGALVQTKKEL